MSGTDANSKRRPWSRLAVLTCFEIIDRLLRLNDSNRYPNCSIYNNHIPTIDTRRENHEKDSCCPDCRRALPGFVQLCDGSWTSRTRSGRFPWPSALSRRFPSGTCALPSGSSSAAASLLSPGSSTAALCRSLSVSGLLLFTPRHLSRHA